MRRTIAITAYVALLGLVVCATPGLIHERPAARVDTTAPGFACVQPAVYLTPGPVPFAPEWHGRFTVEDDGRWMRGDSTGVLAGPFATKAQADSAIHAICGITPSPHSVGADRKQANP